MLPQRLKFSAKRREPEIARRRIGQAPATEILPTFPFDGRQRGREMPRAIAKQQFPVAGIAKRQARRIELLAPTRAHRGQQAAFGVGERPDRIAEGVVAAVEEALRPPS